MAGARQHMMPPWPRGQRDGLVPMAETRKSLMPTAESPKHRMPMVSDRVESSV